MRIDQILEAVKNDLDDWAATLEQKVRISVARDPLHALECLVAGPAGIVLVLHWAGDDNNDAGAQKSFRGLNRIELSVGYNLGLKSPKDEAIWKTTESRPSLLKLVDQARSRLLSIHYPANETGQYFKYIGCEPVTMPDGMPLAAFRLSVALSAVIGIEASYRDAEYTEDEEPEAEPEV